MIYQVISTCQAIIAFVFKRCIPIQKKDYEISVFQGFFLKHDNREVWRS